MKRKKSLVYLDARSLLVINSNGRLRTLFTPFRAKCVKAVTGIPVNTWVIVDEIRQSKEMGLAYLIGGRVISHQNFHIEIRF